MRVFMLLKVFLVRKIKGNDTGHLYAMKVLKKATLKGWIYCFTHCYVWIIHVLGGSNKILETCNCYIIMAIPISYI